MNLNAIRTFLTTAAATLSAIMVFLPQALGCTVDAITSFVSCAHSWLPPKYVGIAILVMTAGNLILKVQAGGTINFGALWKSMAIISNSGKPGTTPPDAVVPKITDPTGKETT